MAAEPPFRSDASPRPFVVEPTAEYRFELEAGEAISIRLVKGRAEVFGAELAKDKWYGFGDECKGAVFSWDGCEIEMSSPSTEYLSTETPLVAYQNIHLALEQRRILARHGGPTGPSGPRVMVIGQEDSGKTSLCKVLLNYAARTGKGWSPIFANLNPADGGPTVPGTLTLTPYISPVSTASPFSPLGSTSTSGAALDPSSSVVPLVTWYGHADPGRNVKLYRDVLGEVARRLEERLERDERARTSGVIIDTPSAFGSPFVGSEDGGKGQKYDLVRQSVEAFKVDVLLVIGHEKLFIEMKRLLSSMGATGASVSLVKIPKSGGVVDLDDAYRSRIQMGQIKSYFYGGAGTAAAVPSEAALSPQSITLKISNLQIYRVGEDSLAPTSALPIGATRSLSQTALERVDLSSASQQLRLVHSVLALVREPETAPGTTRGAEEDLPSDVLLRGDVIGFLLVTAVDGKKGTITLLSPSPGRLPSNVCVLGSFEWQDI